MLAHQGDLNNNLQLLKDLVYLHLPVPRRDQYIQLIDFLVDDIEEEKDGIKTLYLGLRRCPAATGNHHAFPGGLVYHLLEMWEIWQSIKGMISHAADRYVNDSRVLEAILIHDLHKAYKTYVFANPKDPLETYAYYGTDRTDLMMTSDVKSIWLLSKVGITLDEQQMNALLWAEGGFSKIKPKYCTVLAKLCYLLDEMSGNVIDRIRTRTFIELRKPES